MIHIMLLVSFALIIACWFVFMLDFVQKMFGLNDFNLSM